MRPLENLGIFLRALWDTVIATVVAVRDMSVWIYVVAIVAVVVVNVLAEVVR
jgi:hypothetical protein